MSEAKIFTDENGPYVQVADKNLLDEFHRGEPREIESEWEHHNGF